MTSSLRDVLPFPQPRVPQVAAAPAASVLVLSNDAQQAQRIVAELQQLGWSCRAVSTVEAALQTLQQSPSDACCVGQLASGDSLAVLVSGLQQRSLTTQVLRLQNPSDEAPLTLPASGAVEMLAEPYTLDALGCAINGSVQIARMTSDNRRLRRQLSARNLRDMPGQSPLLQAVRDSVQKLAEQSEHLLLRSESGCGSATVGQAIHDASRRSHRPFLAMDCSVLSAETFEEELFGITRPGSMQHTPGRYEQADGGTLYIHCIEQLALPMQRKLVPLLRDQRCEHPVTGERLRSDIRLICSGEVNLDELVEQGLFRSDLLALIRQTELQLPALRDRKDDIGLIVEQQLKRIALREGRGARSLSLEALRLLQAHQWPGNLAELENVIERACGLDWDSKLTPAMVEPWLGQTLEETGDDLPAGLTLREMERRLIESTFIRFGGNREKTARSLQIGIRTLSGKLRDYGYPPRGGPGSNIKPLSVAPTISAYQPAEYDQDDFELPQRRAA